MSFGFVILKFDIFWVCPMQFWLCEKTNIIQPISGREVVEGHVPTLIKWSLPELNTKMKQIAICAIQVRIEH